MTDEARLENDEQQDEVEGHQFRGGALGEPALEPGLSHDDSDDVEGHQFRGGALSEPALEPRLANDEGDDDVEGHMKMRGQAKL
jgi:hypothetical protein